MRGILIWSTDNTAKDGKEYIRQKLLLS